MMKRPKGSLSAKDSDDIHHLVGQIIDQRLRVISLDHVTPHKWLYQVEPPSVGKTRRAFKVLGDPLAREPGAFYRLKTACERLKRLDSPYVERVFECGLLHNLTPYILSEWEPHTSLYESIYRPGKRQHRALQWYEVKPLFIQICEGLSALHKAGLAHGDLRARHVLLRHDLRDPVLIDGCVSSAFGSPPTIGLDKGEAYWAPERHSLAAASSASDMYSLGVLLYMCLHQRLPFAPLYDERYSQQLEQGQLQSPSHWLRHAHQSYEHLPCSEEVPQEARRLITALLAKSPRERPSVSEVLRALRGEVKLKARPAPTTASVIHAPLIESSSAESELERLESELGESTHPYERDTSAPFGMSGESSAAGASQISTARAFTLMLLSSLSAVIGGWLAW